MEDIIRDGGGGVCVHDVVIDFYALFCDSPGDPAVIFSGVIEVGFF
jgi:hypothetical protein